MTNALAPSFPPLRPKQQPRVISIATSKAAPLKIFSTVPPRFGVFPVEYDCPMFRAGEVAVYDEMWDHHPLEDGGIYIIEYQRPAAGMSWEAWGSFETRSRLDIRRSMITARRSARDPQHWNASPMAATNGRGMIIGTDGPYQDWQLAGQIIGKVVGIYNPAAIG
jgi:hypothetical protein